MADFDKMNIDAVPYHVKDTTARQQIAACGYWHKLHRSICG